MYKRIKYKRIFAKVMSVASALVLSCILFFSCVFSTNAYYQEYFAILNPVSTDLIRYNTGNGEYYSIGSRYGFSQFGVYRSFNPTAISGGHALDLYRYRTSTVYTIPAGEYAYYSATFLLSNNRVLQNGNTYRFRFYVETGTSISRSPWWTGSPESIQRYIDEHLYSPNADFWLSYLDLGTRRIALIPSAETTFVFGDGIDRYVVLYDFTLTMESGIQDPVVHVSNRFDFNFDNQATTQFTCGVSQCSVYQVYDSIADAPVFPTPDDSVTNDYSDLESSLHDFSSNSGADGFLDSSNLETSLGTGAISAMRGVSNILQYAYDKWPWLQTLVYFSVALGIIGLLFNLGSALLGRRKGG